MKKKIFRTAWSFKRRKSMLITDLKNGSKINYCIGCKKIITWSFHVKNDSKKKQSCLKTSLKSGGLSKLITGLVKIKITLVKKCNQRLLGLGQSFKENHYLKGK